MARAEYNKLTEGIPTNERRKALGDVLAELAEWDAEDTPPDLKASSAPRRVNLAVKQFTELVCTISDHLLSTNPLYS